MLPDTHCAERHQEDDERSPAFAASDDATHAEVVTGTNIRDLDRREPKFRQDEEELGRIVDLIQQSIVVLNPDGKTTYANRALLSTRD